MRRYGVEMGSPRRRRIRRFGEEAKAQSFGRFVNGGGIGFSIHALKSKVAKIERSGSKSEASVRKCLWKMVVLEAASAQHLSSSLR